MNTSVKLQNEKVNLIAVDIEPSVYLKSLKSLATPEPIHAEQTSHAAAVTCDGVSTENAGRRAAPTYSFK